MIINFSKYQGTGNDFILIDNRDGSLPELAKETIAKMCHRRYGIGADGLIILENDTTSDFKMVYFNSDGNTSSMCGNGGRCIVAFANHLGIVNKVCRFNAVDGEHLASIDGDQISLKMKDVAGVEAGNDHFFLDTGSPHYVKYISDIESYDVFNEGKKIRNNDRFKEKGTNVNFIQEYPDHIFVRTYERGVEDETYSCGTGVTAAGLVHALVHPENASSAKIRTIGGDLSVSFRKTGEQAFSDIWLTGPAVMVFKGEINV